MHAALAKLVRQPLSACLLPESAYLHRLLSCMQWAATVMPRQHSNCNSHLLSIMAAALLPMLSAPCNAQQHSCPPKQFWATHLKFAVPPQAASHTEQHGPLTQQSVRHLERPHPPLKVH